MKKIKLINSPLRYPGSKRKFVNFFVDLFEKNNLRPNLFIEPFAGGASVSINLLALGYVKKIALIEMDSLVSSFWKTVFFDREWLIDEIEKLSINIDSWKYFKNNNPKDIRGKAIKCLFLNRTNFSGVLKGGVIGGLSQSSKYKIDCRFNKDKIISSIKKLSSFSEKVAFIEEGDYQKVLIDNIDLIDKNSFIYFDPPYVNQAKNLYNHYFEMEDHVRLKDFIINVISKKSRWLLSYDNTPIVYYMYKGKANMSYIDIRYSVNNNNIAKELLYSNLMIAS